MVLRIVFFLIIFFNFLLSKEYIIGFAQDYSKNKWGLEQKKEILKEVNKYKTLKLITKDAKGKISKQIMHLEDFIANNVDFIITNPINSKLTGKVLKKAIDKGIKVILIDRKIETNNYTSFISANDKLIAKKAALYLSSKLQKKGTILMLQGIKDASVTKNREVFFEEYITKNTKIKIIKRRANFLRSQAMKEVEKLIKNKIYFDAIYSHSDDMLSGARDVISKYYYKKDIPSVGINFTKEAKKAIKAELQDISFYSGFAVKKSIEIIIKIINNEKVKKNILLDPILIDKNNLNKNKTIF